MPVSRRSAFGELCRSYRRRLRLSQPELRERVMNSAQHLRPGIRDEDLGSTYIAVNTISNWEKARAPGDPFPKPYKSTVKAVALALGLVPSTIEYQNFLAASRLPGPFEEDSGPDRPPVDLPVIDTRPPRDGFVTAGREPQVRQIRGMISRMINGEPGVALVSGVAGTGKTRLIEEICADAVDRYPGLTIAWGECTGDDVSIAALHPFRQIVSMLTGGLREANPRQLVSNPNLTRLSGNAPRNIQTLLNTSPDLVDHLITAHTLSTRASEFSLDEQVADTITRIAQRSSPSPTGKIAGSTLFDFLAACSTGSPLILVVDDLHWADEVSSNVLFHLIRRLHGSHVNIAIIGSYRVAEMEGLPGSTRHPMRRIVHETVRMFPQALIDLSLAVGGDAGRDYIDGALARQPNKLDETFRQQLFTHTSGFPLVVKGVLDIFERDGVLAPNDAGLVELTREPDWQHIPAEIEGIYLERIERMPEPLQLMLHYASLQGDVFIAEVVMTAMQLSPTELQDMLESQLLRIHRLIRVEGATTINRRLAQQYRLEHSLLREVLKKLLEPIPMKTALMHREIALAINHLYGAEPHEYSAITTWHFDQAGDRVAAAQASIAAGDFAMQHVELETALGHFQKVEQLHIANESPAMLIQSLSRSADCQRSRAMLLEGRRLAERAIALAIRNHTLPEKAQALASLAMIEYDLGHIPPAVLRLREALAIRQELDETREIYHLHAMLSHTLYAQGSYEEAIAEADAALQLGSALDDAELQCQALIARTNCFVDLGTFTAALDAYQVAREYAAEAGHPNGLALCILNSALCHLELGDLDAADRAIEEVTNHLRHVNMPQLHSCVDYYAGLIAEAHRNTELATSRFQAAWSTRSRRGQSRPALDPLGGLLRVAILQGDLPEINRLLQDVTSEIDRIGVDGIEHTARLYLALIEANRKLGNATQAMHWRNTGLDFLQLHAAQISDPELRESYLDAVPAHHQLRTSLLY